MHSNKIASIALFAAIFLLLSCADEGIGGKNTLTGSVIIKEIDNDGEVVATYPAQEERVYLIFGADSQYGDDTRTHFDGTYRFEFLRKGSYTIFGYSDCDSCLGGRSPVLINIELDSRSEEFEAPDLVLIRD